MYHDPETIIRDVIAKLLHHLTWLLNDLYFGGAQVTPNIPAGTPFDQSPLAEEIRLICRAANGQITNRADAAELPGTIRSVIERLYCPPASDSYAIPDEFWPTPLGRAIIAARLWLQGDDDAMTLSEAATALYGSAESKHLRALDRLIIEQRVTAWTDPDVRNPRHARRVSRASVEAYRASRDN